MLILLVWETQSLQRERTAEPDTPEIRMREAFSSWD